MSVKWPYVITISDGIVIRTLHRPAFNATDLAALDAIIDRALVMPSPAQPVPKVKEIPPEKAATLTQGEIAREQGYTGDPCDACGAFKLIRTGTCVTCTGCGANSGCS